MSPRDSSLPPGRWQDAARATGLLGPDGTVAATIFAEMTELARRTGAINLGQGFPDVDGPADVKHAAQRAIEDGHNQYPPGPGILELREAVASHQFRHYGLDPDPETEVLVTTGATEALAATILALAGPGDDVVTLEPFYDSHAACIALAGARHVTVPLLPGPDRFRHDVVVVTDEVYEHLTFDDARHVPIATLPGMRQRTITISSAGKTFSFTGWKVGWLHGPEPLVTAVRTVKQFLTYTSGAPFQPAIADALADDETPRALADSLAARRDLLCEGLVRAGFDVVVPQGTYFVIADGAALGFEDGAALCRELPALAGVVAVPVSAFCTPGSTTARALGSRVRFTFVKREEVLAEAVRRLRAVRPADG